MPARKPGRLPPLNALRAFEVSARHLNFRAAADEIGVTQGAVAQQVRHLEDALGVALFERLPRGLALTADGFAYFADVRRALNLIGDATDRLAKRRANVTISTTPSFASRWLIPRLASFGDEHPGVDLRVIADSQFATFQGDGVDLAIRYGKPPFGKGLVTRLLFPVDIYAVCSPALLAPPPARSPARAISPGTRCCTTRMTCGPSFSLRCPSASRSIRLRGRASINRRSPSTRRSPGTASRSRAISSSRATSRPAGCGGCSISRCRCRSAITSSVRASRGAPATSRRPRRG